jgi:hypothetical protein
MTRPKKTPTYPMTTSASPNRGSTARAPPPLRFDEAARTVDLKMKYPMSAMTRIPWRTPIKRRFRLMSPLKMWENSWAMTP